MDPTQNSGAPASSVSSATTQGSAASPTSPAPTTGAQGLRAKIATATAAQSQQKSAPAAQPTANTMGSQQTDQPPAVAAEKPVGQEAQAAAPKIVEVNGRKFDFSKPEVVAKKLVDLESGMRKFQQERDQLKSQVAQLTESAPQAEVTQKINGILTQWEVAMKRAVDDSGNISNHYAASAGVDRMLEGLIPAPVLNSWLQQKLQHHSHLMTLSPEEKQQYLAQYNRQSELERRAIELDLQSGEIESFKTKQQEAEAARVVAETSALITPAFQKYSFDKDFKNPKTVSFLNKQLWEEARSQLSAALENGQDLSSEFVDQVFSGIKSELQFGQESAATESVNRSIDAKKNQAMTGILDAAAGGQKQDKVSELTKGGKASSADILRARMNQALGR